MPEEEEYFTTDTRSVAPEIDPSRFAGSTQDASRAEASSDGSRLVWKRPVGYLALSFLLVATLLTLLWLGI